MAKQARPIDGAAGYRIFLDHGGAIELDEINEQLRGLGLRELKPRSMTHFKKLQRHGYRSYVTQNRLDLAVAGEDAWSEDMRAQYSEIRQSFPGELLFDASWHDVTVESMSAAQAVVWCEPPPGAGTHVVLRLSTTGIERTAEVVRSDPTSGRVDLAFDPYSGLATSPANSPYRLVLQSDVPEEGDNIVAVTDLMVRVERLMVRVNLGEEEVPRVSRLSKSSPLTIEMLGGQALPTIGAFIVAAVLVRKNWYEGSKAKYEAEGIRIDNTQKRQLAQQNADAQLIKTIEAEESDPDPETLRELEVPGLHIGAPDSMTRREFIEACRTVIALPADLVADWIARDQDN